MKACQETTICQEATEADTEKIEPNSGMMQSIVEHQEDCNEDATVKPVEGWKKQHRGRNQAAGQRGQPKELTQGDCGSQRKLAATYRKVFHHARMAWYKGNIFREIVDRSRNWPLAER
jgi:gamma-glutamyltranspeptidase